MAIFYAFVTAVVKSFAFDDWRNDLISLGFLLKEVPAHELAEAIRIVAAGRSLLAPKITRRIIERFVAQLGLDADLQRLSSCSRKESWRCCAASAKD